MPLAIVVKKSHIKKVCFQDKCRSSSEKFKFNNNVNFIKHAKSLEVTDDSSYDYIYIVADVLGIPESIVTSVLLIY